MNLDEYKAHRNDPEWWQQWIDVEAAVMTFKYGNAAAARHYAEAVALLLASDLEKQLDDKEQE